MLRRLLLILVLFSSPLAAQTDARWSEEQVAILTHWLESADDEGLDDMTAAAQGVRAAWDSGDAARANALATQSALRLLRAHRGQCCGPTSRPSIWHIGESRTFADAEIVLETALRQDRLGEMFRAARPSHPYYEALAAAYAREDDAQRRAVIALNLARWRWMPRNLGSRYVLVNAAAMELTVWENGEAIDRRRVIIGRRRTPTPIFEASISGVILNPWWEVPTSIAAEGISSMVRNNPSAARARGYVYQDGRYRQRPGPGNALGRMKLVMPNPYSVFLHDTSNRSLFDQDDRSLSHGCVRVQDAPGFAALLLGPAGWTRERVDAAIEQGDTRTVALDRSMPVYIAYFTAEPGADDTVRYIDDHYGRDGLMTSARSEPAQLASECSAAQTEAPA